MTGPVGLAALLFLRRLVTAPQNVIAGTKFSDEPHFYHVGSTGAVVLAWRSRLSNTLGPPRLGGYGESKLFVHFLADHCKPFPRNLLERDQMP
jgi:hypothetical protein